MRRWIEIPARDVKHNMFINGWFTTRKILAATPHDGWIIIVTEDSAGRTHRLIKRPNQPIYIDTFFSMNLEPPVEVPVPKIDPTPGA
jgi:hypothetical protein